MTIDQPADGAVLPPGNIVVRTTVRGFALSGTGTASPAVVGRIIFYIDVDFVPTTAGQSALTAAGTFQISAQTTATWPNIPEGRHALFVQLVNADQTPLQPAVTDRAVITVSATASSPSAAPTAAA